MSDTPTRILLVEDNPGDARLIRELLRDGGQYGSAIDETSRLADALAALRFAAPDVVLLDLFLPDSQGLDTFSRLHTAASSVPMIVLTGLDDEATALAAVKAGAQDYLVKGLVSAELLSRAIRYAIERQRLLSELRRLLQREREDAARLRALDEMKSVFIAAVAHDLRSPLTAVQGFAEMLTRQADMPKGAAEKLRAIAVSAERMESLLSSLLDLERLSSGSAAPTRTPTDVAALVDRVINDLDLPGHPLESSIARISADIDPVLVERILQNLLLNAANHTPKGTHVWLRVRPVEDGILITVEDDGPGVPDEAKAVIFEAFRRGDAASATRGSGVGLHLVSRFSELHGGRSWVEDRRGGGASFNVFLPHEHNSPSIAAPAADQALAPDLAWKLDPTKRTPGRAGNETYGPSA
jgi:sigma-B regulation protein RsbU (phosphoserine phosphatase)